MFCLNKNGCSIANTGMSDINLYLSVKNRCFTISKKSNTGNIFWIIQGWKKTRIKNKVSAISFAENYTHYDFKTTIYRCVFGKYLPIENERIDN